jgi:hypothetical protein
MTTIWLPVWLSAFNVIHHLLWINLIACLLALGSLDLWSTLWTLCRVIFHSDCKYTAPNVSKNEWVGVVEMKLLLKLRRHTPMWVKTSGWGLLRWDYSWSWEDTELLNFWNVFTVFVFADFLCWFKVIIVPKSQCKMWIIIICVKWKNLLLKNFILISGWIIF